MSIELDRIEAALCLAGLVALQDVAEKIAPEKVEELAGKLSDFLDEISA